MKALVWLPDSSGLMLAAAEKPGMTQVWYLSYPDGASRRVTNDLSDYTSVSLTADSSVLAAVQVNQTLNIWTAAPDGGRAQAASDARQLTSGVSRHDGEYGVSWTPNGKIVYYSLASGSPDIWIMSTDGTGNKQLTSRAGNNSFPSVSPDGRYILFNSDRSGERGIWRMDADGGNLKQLTNEGSLPYGTPDGQWVFYYGGAGRLWKVPIDGGATVKLTTPAKYAVTAPVVSPDGKYIACNYLVEEPGAQFRIGIIPIEGGEPLKVFNVLSHAIKPLRWTADSRAVAYIDTRDGVSNIWMLPLGGGSSAQVTNFKTDFISSFDWSRDGRQLALSRGLQTSDVVLINELK